MDLNQLKNMSKDQLLKFIEDQEAKRVEDAKSKISRKVSRKGGISVYGLGRWPVTLYRSQWTALLASDIAGFIQANEPAIIAAENRWNALSPEQQKAEDAAEAAKAKAGKGKSALEQAVETALAK